MFGLVEQQLGLQQLELEADRPQILAKQEFGVLERELVGGLSVCGIEGTCSAARASTLELRENALGRYWLESCAAA